MVLGGGRLSVVHAAGGLVVRGGSRGEEVLLIHRPKHDDWSFPKGKVQSGERFEDAALREVEEETGYTCELEYEAGSVTYRDSDDRPKLVRYWRMHPVQGEGRFTATPEVDEIRWVLLDEASQVLTYPHDRDLLAR
ncbi:MAG: NUDIX hydrolase [Actinomycetota bacterium]|nr:NUDIX hydrolase [Actinomycetota bacterium]